MSDKLPRGWSRSTLGELFEFKYGKGLVSERRKPDGEFQVFGSNGIVGAYDAAITAGPTIIIGRKGSVGKINFSSKPCWPIDTTYFIDRFPASFPPRYWALYLKSLQLGEQEKSSAIPGISRDAIYETEIVVPPPAEQRRIVAKLEKLLGKVEACQKRLEKIPLILKRFRQSILAAACSGGLTADWRVQYPDVLKYADLGEPEKPKGEDLPQNWRQTTVGALSALVTSGSRGWAKYYSDCGSLFIRAQNINADFLNLSEPAHVRFTGR